MIVCFIIFGMFIILFVLSSSQKTDRKGIQGIFDRMGRFLAVQFVKRKGERTPLFAKEEERQALLHPASDSGKAAREAFAGQISMGLAILFAGTVLSLLLGIKELTETSLPGGASLERASYGGGSREESLFVREEDEEEERGIDVSVEERKYTDAEVDELFDRVEEELPAAILGNNESLDEVREDLSLSEKLSDFPVEIEWQSGNYDVMDSEGHLTGENMDESGVVVGLTAKITYFEDSRILELAANVYPKKLSREENWMAELKSEIEKLDKKTASGERLTLPESLNGKKLVWSRKKENTFVIFLLLTLAAAAAIPVGKWQDGKKQLEERKRQMLLDYSDVVNKLVLFLGAGMTVGAAMKRLVAEYEERQSSLPVKKEESPPVRYAYEELAVTLRELESGVPEGRAYERFGERCRVQEYLKLGTLLSQNLRKGTRDLTDMLELEARAAFESRRRLARRQGEEAGTKLLVPMVMMLGVVLLIIVVPAFASFGI